MKQTVLFLLFVIASTSLIAQCTPNELYRDSTIGVYPRPLDDDNPDGGIQDTACINSAFEFTLTIKIPSTVTVNGFEVGLDSITLATQGAVTGLPIGINYDCFPENCVYTPADTLGCLRILGTASSENEVGDYSLGINTTIYTNTLGSIDVAFPNQIIEGMDGQYILTLAEEGSGNCFVVGTEDYLSQQVRVRNTPNPFGSVTTIEVVSDISETLHFSVFDMVGNLVEQRKVSIQEGANHFDFDGAHLPNGIYTYTLSSDAGRITRRMVVSH